MTCCVFQVQQNRQDEPLTEWRGRAAWGRSEEEQGEEVKKMQKETEICAISFTFATVPVLYKAQLTKQTSLHIVSDSAGIRPWTFVSKPFISLLHVCVCVVWKCKGMTVYYEVTGPSTFSRCHRVCVCVCEREP